MANIFGVDLLGILSYQIFLVKDIRLTFSNKHNNTRRLPRFMQNPFSIDLPAVKSYQVLYKKNIPMKNIIKYESI